MIVHAIKIELEFPAGVTVGDIEEGNVSLLSRNGMGEFIIPGTSIAGVLRHRWEDYCLASSSLVIESEVAQKVIGIFGSSAEDEKEDEAEGEGSAVFNGSPLYVPDAVLDIGDGEVREYTYHMRNRHTGTALEGGLYTLETIPPQTKTSFILRLEENDDRLCSDFLKWLFVEFKNGIIFGGNSNRGVGLAILIKYNIRTYVLDDIEEHIRYLNDCRMGALAINENSEEDDTQGVEKKCDINTGDFVIEVKLGIPRGQDILISDPDYSESAVGEQGNGNGSSEKPIDLFPMRVTAGDGEDYWRLPGSTLFGLFRDWTTRLAARDDKLIANSYANFEKCNEDKPYSPARVGNLFIDDKNCEDDEKRQEYIDQFEVADLFGSMHKSGRLHISDSFSKVSESSKSTEELAKETGTEVQRREHVSINSISGGAEETGLFNNAVITSCSANSPEWSTKIIVQKAKKTEVEWIAKCLKALHIGLLRVGSSKSSGRLEVKIAPELIGSKELTNIFNEKLNMSSEER